MRLVQLRHPQHGRRVGIVEDTTLCLLSSYHSIYNLANAAIGQSITLDSAAQAACGTETLSYDQIYAGRSNWSLLPAFDHPQDPAYTLVSGTGLTHKASAENRSRMHQHQPTTVTDSMRMYQMGLESGSPPAGQVGVQPEWFYKGSGAVLRAHGEPLTIPPFGEDGGEEPEIAGAYLIGPDGTPYRVGYVTGNEFSDHKMEKRNYLYLAPSKMRQCSIGPELITTAAFQNVQGSVAIERGGNVLWSAIIYTGEKNMSHTVANLEHHHFKYPEHRRPGDVHIHFYGADAFSFGEGVELRDGDVMIVSWSEFGRPLRNTLRLENKPEPFVSVRGLSDSALPDLR